MSFTHQELRETFRELHIKQRALQEREENLQRRDDLEKQVQDLQEKIRSYTRRNLPQESSPLAVWQEELATLLQDLSYLDHQLDLAEEEALPEKLQELHNILENALAEKSTHHAATLQELKQAELDAQHFHFMLSEALLLVEEMEHHLKEVLSVRQRTKGLGIVFYIFGRNPNQHINQLMAIVEQILKDLKTRVLALPRLHRENENTFHNAIQAFVENYDAYYDREWSVRRFDNKLKDTLEVLSILVQKLKVQKKQGSSLKEKSKNALSQWIEEQLSKLD